MLIERRLKKCQQKKKIKRRIAAKIILLGWQKESITMSKRLSTYEKAMQDPEFRKEYKKRYKSFILSELIIALMTNNDQSVRSLAKECGISASIINKIRTGKQEDLKLSNFINLMEVFGYDLILEKGNERIPLSQELEEIPMRRTPLIHRRVPSSKRKPHHSRKAG